MGVVYMVRHAQAEPNAYGSSALVNQPGALTELGRRQAHKTGRALADRLEKIDMVMCGDLQRQRETLEILMRSIDARAWQTDADWNEYDLDSILGGQGLAATMHGRELQKLVDVALVGWVDSTSDERGETYLDFESRCIRALRSASEAASAGKTVLVVSSAGPISQIAARTWGLDGHKWARLSRTMLNASVSKVVVGANGHSVVSFNEHAHLERLSDVGEQRFLMTYR